jgi:hypothetical protein
LRCRALHNGMLPPKPLSARRIREQARLIRECTPLDIVRGLDNALAVLHAAHIPHFVYGGFAVQEHGYARVSFDIDLIVPDVTAAKSALLAHGFTVDAPPPPKGVPLRPCPMKATVYDKATGCPIDLFPGGQKLSPDSPLPLPMPSRVSKHPQILTLEALLEAKLSCYVAYAAEMNVAHLRHYGRPWVPRVPRTYPPSPDADLVEILKARLPPRSLADDLDPAVRALFFQIYDGLVARDWETPKYSNPVV